MAELADLEALDQQLGQGYPGATLDDVDVEALEQRLGSSRRASTSRTASAETRARAPGLHRPRRRRAAAHPEGPAPPGRDRAQAGLRRARPPAAAATTTTSAPGRPTSRTGPARPWVFGDEQPLDATRTVANALRRAGLPAGRYSCRRGLRGGRDRAAASAAVALCVDLSYSMVQEGRWGPMKQTALALSHLVATRFPQDALQIIGFDRLARRLSPAELADARAGLVQGTNLQHALMLAGRHLRRHPDAEPVVLVVTDGEPTAHLATTASP